jgi:hypothetical protein
MSPKSVHVFTYEQKKQENNACAVRTVVVLLTALYGTKPHSLTNRLRNVTFSYQFYD